MPLPLSVLNMAGACRAGGERDRCSSPDAYEDRSIDATLNLAWELMSMFPRDILTLVSETELAKYHQGTEYEDAVGVNG
ncbi:MAG: hypothetical protein WBG92_01340 [Thiohalocapsa sp.]